MVREAREKPIIRAYTYGALILHKQVDQIVITSQWLGFANLNNLPCHCHCYALHPGLQYHKPPAGVTFSALAIQACTS